MDFCKVSPAVGEILDNCNLNSASLLLSYGKETYRDFNALLVERFNLLGGAAWSYRNQQWLMIVDYALVLDAFLDTEGFWDEDKHNLELALAVVDNLESGYENRKALILHDLAVIYMAQGDYSRAQSYFEQSLAFEQQLGDRLAVSRTLNYLGRIHASQKDYEKTNQLYQESLALGEEVSDDRGVAVTLHELGTLYLNQGDYDQARVYYERSLDRYKESAPVRDTASTLHQLGVLSYRRGDLQNAHGFFEQALQLDREISHQEGIARALLSLGKTAYDRGDLIDAQRKWEESARIYEHLGMAEAETARNQLSLLPKKNDLI